MGAGEKRIFPGILKPFLPLVAEVQALTPPADINRMGEMVKLPNCREISPGVFRLIARRTKKASYWVRYWSAYRSTARDLIAKMNPEEVDDGIFDDARLYLANWLHDRNRAAIKTRGF